MKILVANLGSTSFKYRLYDLGDPAEPLLAHGAVDRIGSQDAKVSIRSAKREIEQTEPVLDHAAAVQLCLDQLVDPDYGVLKTADEVAAIGFKAVHARLERRAARERTRPRRDGTLQRRHPRAQSSLCGAMRMLNARFPHIPLVAAFESGFHQTIADANRRYAIPDDWATKLGVVRHGFHGASHRYIAERAAALFGRTDLKIISCHLGGSSSLCAIRNGKSVATSMGMSPQSGLPQNNRVGDFDIFALPALLEETDLTLDEILDTLANRSGLEGLSGVGRDLRDIEVAADAGDSRENGDRRLCPRDSTLSRRVSRRARRGRRDRLHRRHRRKLVDDAIGRLPRPRLVRHRARPPTQRRRQRRGDRFARFVARPSLGVADQRGNHRRPPSQRLVDQRDRLISPIS